MNEQMNEQLISFNTAKLAKEKGFNLNESAKVGFSPDGLELSESFWNYHCNEKGSIARPTQSLLQKWLREVCKISVLCHVWNGLLAHYCITSVAGKHNTQTRIYDTYEEALEEGLQKAIQLI